MTGCHVLCADFGICCRKTQKKLIEIFGQNDRPSPDLDRAQRAGLDRFVCSRPSKVCGGTDLGNRIGQFFVHFTYILPKRTLAVLHEFATSMEVAKR
jgi:hypothetical protein